MCGLNEKWDGSGCVFGLLLHHYSPPRVKLSSVKIIEVTFGVWETIHEKYDSDKISYSINVVFYVDRVPFGEMWAHF